MRTMPTTTTALNALTTRTRVTTRRCASRRASSNVTVRAAVTSSLADIDAPNPAAIYDVVDEEAMLAASDFPIKPDDLIARCKTCLRAGFAVIGDELADDFQFIGPVVGPLPKDAFVSAVGGFDLTTGFPDMKSNYHAFRVDPFEPNRVWFQNRTIGTHTGVLAGSMKPTGIKVECPPQALSMTFNEAGKITKITVGVCMDRTIGNTGGLGGVFALFYATGNGLPFPEAQPWKMSKRYKFFQFLGRLASNRNKKD